MELVVVLVAVVAVTAGLLQIAALSRVRLQMLNEARGSAAAYAISDSYLTIEPAAQLLTDWSKGKDQQPMSADDIPGVTTPGLIRDDILAYAHPEELDAVVPGNVVSAAMMQDPLIDAFGLVRGHAKSDPIPLIPVARHLFYQADSITLEADAVTVWMKGLP